MRALSIGVHRLIRGLLMSEEMEVLKEVAQRLESLEIPFMVTGSMAANFYAVPRMTRDIDIVIEVKRKDVDKLVSTFKNNFYIDREMVAQSVSEQGMFNVIHTRWVVKVDFIVRKDVPYRIQEFERRKSIEIDGVKIWIVSPEDLVLSKLFWARESLSELQLRDIKNILVVTKGLDMDYIENWVKTLGLEKVFLKARI